MRGNILQQPHKNNTLAVVNYIGLGKNKSPREKSLHRENSNLDFIEAVFE